MVDRHPMDLSVGERQRLAIVGATAHAPPLWLLDEPCRGMDGHGRAWLAGLLDHGPAIAKRIGLIVLVGLALYFPVGMIWTHAINDDLEFQAAPADRSFGSAAVALAAALIEREVNQSRWVANDPFFFPTAPLDNMPNYQQGIIAALARFSFELMDQIARTRGSSQTDPDLREAAGLLQYPGTKWVFDFSVSIAPTATSEAQYRQARRALLAYNDRLAAGEAVFQRRADNLLATLDRIALDLGASSAALDKRITEHSGDLIDFESDDLFYGVKGQLYAYYLLLRELKGDFESVIAERELMGVYGQMLESMAAAAALDPWVVVNGDPDGQVLPTHLAAQGFYLLRARTQLREITNILLK